MAIKPEDCTVLQDKEEKLLKELESSIDNKLMNQYIEGSQVNLFITKPSLRVLTALLDRYKCAGWDIDVSDSGGGGYRNDPPMTSLLFKERSNIMEPNND